MEAIDGLDEVCAMVARGLPGVQNLCRREVVVDEVEVLELAACFSYDLLVLVIEDHCMCSGLVTNRLVGVEPSPARIAVDAVQEVVQVLIGDTSSNRVHMRVEHVIEKTTIRESNSNHMRAGRQTLVQFIEDIVDVALEHLGRRRFIQIVSRTAHIIAKKLEEHHHRLIESGVAVERKRVRLHVVGVSSVHSQVLEVAEVALIAAHHFLIN